MAASSVPISWSFQNRRELTVSGFGSYNVPVSYTIARYRRPLGPDDVEVAAASLSSTKATPPVEASATTAPAPLRNVARDIRVAPPSSAVSRLELMHAGARRR